MFSFQTKKNFPHLIKLNRVNIRSETNKPYITNQTVQREAVMRDNTKPMRQTIIIWPRTHIRRTQNKNSSQVQKHEHWAKACEVIDWDI